MELDVKRKLCEFYFRSQVVLMACCITWGLLDTILKLIKCISRNIYWYHQFDVMDVASPFFLSGVVSTTVLSFRISETL